MQLKWIGLMIGCMVLGVGCGKVETNTNPAIEELQKFLGKNQVVVVDYETEVGVFSAGTAFVVQPEYSEERLLLTAHHVFGPPGGLAWQLTGEEVGDFVEGGTLYDAFTLEVCEGTIDQVLVIPQAEPLPNMAYDLAAFVLKDDEGSVPLSFGLDTLDNGEMVYLLAPTKETKSKKIQVHEAYVMNQTDTELYYAFKTPEDFTGTSGAPVVNKQGEVVAIHLGGGEQFGMTIGAGQKTNQINKTLKKAYTSYKQKQ